MKKVMLLFPPEWVPTAPYLALPSLTAVLRQKGVEVVQKDINVEMYDHFFSRRFLEFIQDKIKKKLKELRGKVREGTITEEESGLKSMLHNYTTVDLDHHIRKVERAKVIMRGEEFYKVEKAEWALNSFREVMELISAAYYPASIQFYHHLAAVQP